MLILAEEPGEPLHSIAWNTKITMHIYLCDVNVYIQQRTARYKPQPRPQQSQGEKYSKIYW